MRETALLAQPVAAAGREVCHRVGGEELGGDPAQGGLLGDRLRAVLTELRRVPVVRLGPGAARAVEAVLLIDPQQRQRGALHTHLLLGDAQRVPDRRKPGRGVLGLGDLRRVLNRIALGRLRGHRGPPPSLAPVHYTHDPRTRHRQRPWRVRPPAPAPVPGRSRTSRTVPVPAPRWPCVPTVSGAWQDRGRGRDSIEEDRQDLRRRPSTADADGRALARLPRVLRAARGELHDRDGPADERDLRLRVDAGQHPA